MKGKYKAAFFIVRGTKKFLGQHGWEFDSSDRISESVRSFLTGDLCLKYAGTKLGISYYENDNYQASLLLDENHKIENIYIQVYSGKMKLLQDQFGVSELSGAVELFIP